ncbi:leucine-rich repeat domain-containing protein [Lentilactobacillus sp. G22-6]|uniref:MucBP domain-containing protein n=2 Tax=Lentilactobacillus TaxID=2767893 RepID=UPI001C27A617|nr:MucBP domain-containing protein [Lentilactobacillus dabitei]MBU9789655.1 leucine-rich repeat domain-containing protein [Lentilactobacillus dabitei]
MDNIDYHQKAKLRWLFKTIMVAVATVLFGLSFNLMGGGQQRTLAADTNTNAALDELMPNERLQQLVLYNMKDQGIVDDEYTLSQFTPTSFKDDLGKMTQLVWQPGDDKSDDYNNLDAWNGGNGAIGQPNPNPGNYSLKGLEYCKNLTDLELSQSNFDFGHHLFRNDIVDVSPLSGLVKLQKIDLSRERITDITPISKLPNVTYLNINFNSISDLSSLDAKQYTDGFWYEGQSYVLPFKNLPSDSYSWVTPFEGKLPKDVNYLPTEVYSAARQGVVLNYAPEDNPAGPNFPHTYLEIFYGGAVPTISGGSLLFNDLAPQAEATTDNPWNNQMKVVKNTYKNYMIAYYRQGQNTNPTFTAYIPYETNVAESKYEIQPVDKNGNNISGYTPTSFPGTEGDKVSVPTISGYTVNDNKVVDGQITLPAGDSSQTTIIKVIYDKNTVPYTIHPVDKDGNSLGHDVSGEDAAGKAVDIPDIPGYVVNDSKVVNNAGHNQVIIPDSGGNINVIYAKTFANETTLNVNYLDNDNNQLLQQKLIHGSVNDPYTVTDDYYPDTLTINGQLYIWM